ncbi:hypothetical protein Pmani_006326 [Petrolisthes manimaculis]|uniref:Uncharacterized protein n=1 Tax=Petrolisthes manimaculis TaxID=1843537 RepID=A0AAE1UL77_9EUCA|nr:hypothetical protein Pmani_006326 [Petrolisthes manimaculis]
MDTAEVDCCVAEALTARSAGEVGVVSERASTDSSLDVKSWPFWEVRVQALIHQLGCGLYSGLRERAVMGQDDATQEKD